MQVRMNVSALEEWARANNRQPDHYENGSMTASGESTVDAARHHFAPVIQLLQWLQIFSAIGDSEESLKSTIEDLPRLTPQQITHAVKYYRAEVGEKGLPKSSMKFLNALQKEHADRKMKMRSGVPPTPSPTDPKQSAEQPEQASSPVIADDDELPENLLLDPALMLPFSLPTSNDMIISYGAGFGGVNRERERKYIPTVPPEFLAKLDVGSGMTSHVYENWNEE